MFKELIDMKTFEAIVGCYGADYCGGDMSEAVLNKYIDNHVKRKGHIFKLFGEKLKIEKELDVAISEQDAYELKELLIEELMQDRKNLFAASFLKQISMSEFFSNTLENDYALFNVVLKRGMKVSKALGKLSAPSLVDAVQTQHSMCYQKLFARGKAVISIDPCDYVTMSSNSSGWRSCHRLDGGEYRTGPLAYLNDSSTVICYIESSNKCNLRWRGEDYTHSNKVWRQLALVSPTLEYSLQERQYPNYNSLNEKAISEMFLELFENYNEKKYRVSNERIDTLSSLHVDYATEESDYALYYNDILHGMFSSANLCYPSSVSIQDLVKYDKSLKPLKGAEAYCLGCGDYPDDSGSLYCENCGDSEDDEW